MEGCHFQVPVVIVVVVLIVVCTDNSIHNDDARTITPTGLCRWIDSGRKATGKWIGIQGYTPNSTI